MKSEFERAKTKALLQTALICLVGEVLVLVALRLFSVNMLEAAFLSIVVFGPLSAWFSRPLYRNLLRGNQ